MPQNGVLKALLMRLAGAAPERGPASWNTRTSDIELPDERGNLVRELYKRFGSKVAPLKPLNNFDDSEINALYENDMRQQTSGSPEFFLPRPPLK